MMRIIAINCQIVLFHIRHILYGLYTLFETCKASVWLQGAFCGFFFPVSVCCSLLIGYSINLQTQKILDNQ